PSSAYVLTSLPSRAWTLMMSACAYALRGPLTSLPPRFKKVASSGMVICCYFNCEVTTPQVVAPETMNRIPKIRAVIPTTGMNLRWLGALALLVGLLADKGLYSVLAVR